ncbi:MAG: tetratricopeptide repeat protein [Gammaproteobacteria bacterium]|jgi:tetratricopeptide (TPR) repeat protein
MSNKLIVTALCFASFAFALGNAHAVIAPPQNGLHELTIQQDDGINETTAIAERIWDKLTAEFIEHYEEGRYARAATTARSAFELAQSTFGPNHINTADSMLKLGIVAETLGDLETAKTQMLNALSILEVKLGPTHEDVAVVLTNLANVYFEENEPELSEKNHLRALSIRKQAYGESDAAVAQSMYNLAVLYDDLMEYDKAIENYEEAIRIWNSTLGATHPYVANALNNLANIYLAKGELDTAEELHSHSLAIRKLLYGRVHSEVARSLINLGALYVKQDAYEKAKPVYKEAVAIAEKLFGPSHPQVAMLLYSLANIYHIQGRMDRNEEQELMVQKVSLTESGDNPNTQNMKSQIKNLHKSSQTYFSKALPLYERALKILDSTLGTSHPAMTAMLTELALLYKSVGDLNKAAQMQARLNEIH